MFLTGKVALDIRAGAPNNGRGSADQGNVTPVKQHRTGGRTYPYGSAQWWRRILRDSLPATEVPSPVTAENKQAYTSGRPDKHTDDDLFGYMAAVKKSAYMRDTVLACGSFVSVTPERPTRDFGTMTRGLSTGQNPVPHEHEFYTAALASDVRIDLARVGFFEQQGNVRQAALSEQAAKEAQAAGVVEATLRGNAGLVLPLEERRRRVGVLLRTMAEMQGGAGEAAHYGDRTPALVLLTGLKGGNDPFTRVLRADEDEARFDTDIFREELEAWSDVTEGPVRLGWAPGFLGDQRDGVRRELKDLVDGGQLVIGHPRTVLRQLAEEFEGGQHDHWFQD